MSERIRVAQIVNSQGIRGEVRCIPLTEDIERFDTEKPFYIGETMEKVFVESFRQWKNLVILKFQGYNNINEILKFKGEYLTVNLTDVKELQEDEYFHFDLLGLTVTTPEGEKVGTIKEILPNAANDIYVVQGEKGEILIPAVKAFIRSVDISKKCMVVQMEGLDEI